MTRTRLDSSRDENPRREVKCQAREESANITSPDVEGRANIRRRATSTLTVSSDDEMSDGEAEMKPSLENQKFLTEFIEVYHSYSCLWKYSSKEYRNREVKERAYEALLDKMREMDPRADKNSVMRKINALRTAFRREYKKVHRATMKARDSKCQKKGYAPTLWYYDLLKFVVEQQDFSEAAPGSLITDWPEGASSQVPSVAYTSVDEDGKYVDHNAETFIEYLEDSPSLQVVKLEPTSPAQSRPATPNYQSVPELSSASSLNLEINSVYSEKSGNNTPVCSKRGQGPTTVSSRKRRNQHLEEQSSCAESEESHEKAGPSLAPAARETSADQQLFAQPRPLADQQMPAELMDVESSSNLDRFGNYVVSKLRRSTPKQCIIAEKIIAEVLMRANLGILDENTTLTDIKAPQNHST